MDIAFDDSSQLRPQNRILEAGFSLGTADVAFHQPSERVDTRGRHEIQSNPGPGHANAETVLAASWGCMVSTYLPRRFPYAECLSASG